MSRNKIVTVLLVIGGLVVLSSGLFAENLTLSTYYPAPFGAYDRLKLVPRESLTLDPHCDDSKDVGTMYYDNGEDKMEAGVHACREMSKDNFGWIMMGRRPISVTQKPKNAKVVCVKDDDTFGVCINNPSFDGTCGCK